MPESNRSSSHANPSLGLEGLQAVHLASASSSSSGSKVVEAPGWRAVIHKRSPLLQLLQLRLSPQIELAHHASGPACWSFQKSGWEAKLPRSCLRAFSAVRQRQSGHGRRRSVKARERIPRLKIGEIEHRVEAIKKETKLTRISRATTLRWCRIHQHRGVRSKTF